jgi:hypothetical protein
MRVVHVVNVVSLNKQRFLLISVPVRLEVLARMCCYLAGNAGASMLIEPVDG